MKTETQPRRDQHSNDAWKKYFRLADVIAAEHHLVATMFNPDDRSCWGYKDIQIGRNPSRHATFVRDLQYLAEQCKEPRFLFHTRRSLARELESKIISRSPADARATIEQWECFHNYCDVSSKYVNKSSICRLPPGTRAVPTFWHTLEDIYGGEQPPSPTDVALPVSRRWICISLRKDSHARHAHRPRQSLSLNLG